MPKLKYGTATYSTKLITVVGPVVKPHLHCSWAFCLEFFWSIQVVIHLDILLPMPWRFKFKIFLKHIWKISKTQNPNGFTSTMNTHAFALHFYIPSYISTFCTVHPYHTIYPTSWCIDLIALAQHSTADTMVFGVFDVHHKEWLVHSHSTDALGVNAFNFAMSKLPPVFLIMFLITGIFLICSCAVLYLHLPVFYCNAGCIYMTSLWYLTHHYVSVLPGLSYLTSVHVIVLQCLTLYYLCFALKLLWENPTKQTHVDKVLWQQSRYLASVVLPQH